MISNEFSGPPKPASASATMGTNQSILAPPSECSIWSARWKVRLMRRHSSGPALAGERLWSGYIAPAGLASAAARQPDREIAGRPARARFIALVAGNAPHQFT